MADKIQIIAQIRFSLEQLSERNAQHEWEHLCRHFARERICSNILPATGPVQAGGDQGRDFETFQTYLSRTHLKERSFVGLISNKPLAFACSLEKKVKAKIQNDVRTIVSSGTAVEGVFFFSSRSIAIAEQHKLKEWARDTQNIQLEIFDAVAMSELLAEQDLFWLSVRFLQLPAELIISTTIEDNVEMDWYTHTLNKWRERTTPATTFADFSEVRSAAYIARGPRIYSEEGQPLNAYERPELPFWIERFDELDTETNSFSSLRRHAVFESCVLRLRGLGSLIGQETRLQHFFSNIEELEDVSLLSEANTLLVYLSSAIASGLVLLSWTETDAWFSALDNRINELLKIAKKNHWINEKCALLEIRGHLILMRHMPNGTINVSDAIRQWTELAKSIKSARLFPLEHFSHNLNEMANTLGEHADADYEELTQVVDDLLGERFGHFKVAESCLARAKSFMYAGDLPKAMAQLHRAKIDWFAEETIDKSLFAQALLSEAYKDQHLFFAAKYYALSGAYGALYSKNLEIKQKIVDFLEIASSCDYRLGFWSGFLLLSKRIVMVYPHHSNSIVDDFNIDGSTLQLLMFSLVMVTSTTTILYSDIAEVVREQCVSIMQKIGLEKGFLELCTINDQRMQNQETQALWQQIEEQLQGAPWCDTGTYSSAQWNAYGVSWTSSWKNDFQTHVAAEGFLAALQIVLSDLAGYDLYLMRTSVKLYIRLRDNPELVAQSNGKGYEEFDVSFEYSDSERLATVILPPYQRFVDGTLSQSDLFLGTLAVVNELLAEVSLLPLKEFQKMLEARFKQGLVGKLFVGTSYVACMLAFLPQDETQIIQQNEAMTKRSFVRKQKEPLDWIETISPKYDEKKAILSLKNRYRKFILPMNITLQRLRSHTVFIQTVEKLRGEGWKDWHILGAVNNITLNDRMNNQINTLNLDRYTQEGMRSIIREWVDDPKPEPEGVSEIAFEQFSEDKLRMSLKMYMLAFAITSGLENHQDSPDFVALEEFLSKRFRFWADDVEHDNPFEPV